MHLSEKFRCITAPGSNRKAYQLTQGCDFCYPLYYFIPTVSADSRYLIYHRESTSTPHEVQLHRLDLHTAESIQLTHGTSENAHWQPWGEDPAVGILADRAALSPQFNQLVYIDHQNVMSVDIHSLEQRKLFQLPFDRFFIAQNCFTGDGQWFVYIHVDREKYQQLLQGRLADPSSFRKNATHVTETQIAAYNLKTGEHRTLLQINYPVHHIHPYRDRYLVFSHIPGHPTGMAVTDINGNWYTVPRTTDTFGGSIVHHLPTSEGITYELSKRSDGFYAGICDPLTHNRYEFAVVDDVNHTGRDPGGEIFFYETSDKRLEWLVAHDCAGSDDWQRILGPWQTFGNGQKTHLHPQLTEDHQYIMITAGDAETETNHIFLVESSDLKPTQGIPKVIG